MFLFRKASGPDIPAILDIIEYAKRSMAELGLPQWQNGYPNRQSIAEDIQNDDCYVLTKNDAVAATSALVFGEEADYRALDEGTWTTKPPYAVIHRMAADGKERGSGAAAQLLAELEAYTRHTRVRSIRTDTHPLNSPMRRFLEKNGYAACGTLHLGREMTDDAQRIAYEKKL